MVRSCYWTLWSVAKESRRDDPRIAHHFNGGLVLWSAQAVLAPSLYEAMLRSPWRLRCFLPGDVRNAGYAVSTWMVRTAYPTCLGLFAGRMEQAQTGRFFPGSAFGNLPL